MTDNRTTELLAQRLEERGLSCQTDYLHAVWRVGSKLYDAVDNFDGTLTVDNLTPEQAIAATLGDGTLTAEQVSKAVYAHSIHADCADADWQAIADELNARAERTCRVESKIFIEGEYVPCPYYEYEMECGGQFRWDEVESPKFCPNCGARVIGTEAGE